MARSTTSRLRHEIDSGRTGDKIAVEDPAAAPLGTDAEAAGTPPSQAEIASAIEMEVASPAVPGNERPDYSWIPILLLALVPIGLAIAALTAVRSLI